MDFNDLLQSLMNPGVDGPSASIYDDLSASYTNATSTRDARIQVSEESVARLQAELLAAKAANWDLVQQIPVAEPVDTTDVADDDDDSDIGDDDDFFEDEEK